HSDFDSVDPRQWGFFCGLQTTECEVFQDDAFVQNTPAKIPQFNFCPGIFLDLLDDILSGAYFQRGPDIAQAQCGNYQKCDQQHAEYGEDAPLIQKPQCCSFCEHLRATCQFRDFVVLESDCFGFHPQPGQVVESDLLRGSWLPAKRPRRNSSEPPDLWAE